MAQFEPFWSLKDLLLHKGDKTADITVACKGKCFRVLLHPNNLEGSPEISQRYHQLMDSVLNDYPEETSEEDLLEWTLEPFSETFRQIESPSKYKPVTLQDYIFLEVYRYVPFAVDGCMRLFLDYRAPRSGLYGVSLEGSEIPPGCLRFSPTEIGIWSTDDEKPLSRYNLKVIAGGKTYFFKPVDTASRRNALRELETYRKIEETDKPVDLIRTPRLYGVVQEPESGNILGLLLSWIECDTTTLHCALMAKPPLEKRQKWTTQVSTTVTQLHKAGIVWGNATPDNVLIDANDDAWVVDFGGGYTKGWISKHHMETLVGDNEGTLQTMELLARGKPSTRYSHEQDRRARSVKRRLGGNIRKFDSHEDVGLSREEMGIRPP